MRCDQDSGQALCAERMYRRIVDLVLIATCHDDQTSCEVGSVHSVIAVGTDSAGVVDGVVNNVSGNASSVE